MKAVQLALFCACVFGVPCVKADCQFGSNANEASVDDSLRGQLVDLENPLTCSGSIVAWHFCFYTVNLEQDEINTPHTAYFRVYRSINATELQRVHDVETSLQLRVREGREDLFLCHVNMLGEDQYLDVLEGDILAAYLPTLLPPLLLVGSNTQGTLYVDTRVSETPFTAPTLPTASLAVIENHVIHLHADVVGTTETDGSGQIIPLHIVASPLTSAMLPFTPTTFTSASKPVPTSMTSVLNLTTGNLMLASNVPNPTITLFEATSSHSNGNGTTFQTSTAQPRLNTVGIAAIAVVGVLFVTVLILITAVLVISLKQCGKYKDKKKCYNNNASLDNVVYEQQSADSHDGPMEILSISAESQVVVSGEPHLTHANSDHVLEPRVLISNGAIQKSETEEMIYEQATAEVFHIYANATHPASADVISRIRKVVSSLERSTAIPYCVPASEEHVIYQQLSQHKLLIIQPHDIQIIEHLGSGQFSEVEKAQWISNDGTEVAVKTLHNDATGRSKIRCLQEAAMMAQFHHPNVVTFHGIIRESNKISLVMEFLVNGDLSQYLLTMRTRYDNLRHLAEANIAQLLLSYSQQVALGMLYLSDKGFIHRDLAARNVFVSDRDICKVGDFGMSRDLADAEYYISEGGTIPIEWTAPEAVYYHKYSPASDVWSYGCLLYEIWSMGQKPFMNTFIADVLRKLKIGYRLPPPPGCPHDIYKLMIECWNPSADSRPGFQDILVSLLGDEEQVLAIPLDDASTCDLASCLGASLENGYKMYLYLQGLYKPANSPSLNHSMCELKAHTGPNDHGMVYIKEKTSSFKHLQEQRISYYNVSLMNPVPQLRHCIANQGDYACVTDRMKYDMMEDEEYSKGYNSQEATPLSHSKLYHHTSSNWVEKTGHPYPQNISVQERLM